MCLAGRYRSAPPGQTTTAGEEGLLRVRRICYPVRLKNGIYCMKMVMQTIQICVVKVSIQCRDRPWCVQEVRSYLEWRDRRASSNHVHLLAQITCIMKQ